MNENAGAASLVLEDADDLRRIAAALAEVKVQGDRYPAHLASRVGK